MWKCNSLNCVWLSATPWTIAHHSHSPWDSPGKKTVVGSHSFLHGIFPTQGSNPDLHWRQILCHLSHQGIPIFILNAIYPFSSVAQSCPTLCDTTDCRTADFPVHHQLLKLAQTYVHLGGDAFQPLHPLLSPSPPTFSLSQHQCLF